MMNRIRILFVIGFMLSMCAGVVVGMVVSKKPAVATSQPSTGSTSRPRPFTDPLNLSTEQKSEIDKAWEAVRNFDRTRNETRHLYEQEKTDGIYNLIPADKQAAYDQIQVQYATRLQELDKERDRIRNEAETKMKLVLTPDQWDKFEKMRQQRGPGRRPRGGATPPTGLGMPPPGGPGFPGKHPHDSKTGDPKLSDLNRPINDPGHAGPNGSEAGSK